MKFLRWACGIIVVCVLICGCGDVFRPVATPLPQPSPDPQNFRVAAFTSCELDQTTMDCSPAGQTSMVTILDISGNTIEGVLPVGLSPKFALVSNNANGSNSGTATITTADFDGDTLTELSDTHLISTSATAPTLSVASTIGLPVTAKPTSLVTANGTTYVAESGRDVVGVISGSLTAEIPVGVNPINLTVLPSGDKIYAVNRTDNSVTVIATSTNNVLTTIGVGSTPVFAVPSADSSHVFVVNQGSNNVSVIDATTDTLVTTLAVGTAPNFAFADVHNHRILVTNPQSNSLSVIDADPTSSTFDTVIKTITVGTNPTSVTALADGSRIYVANTGSNSVSVINSLSLTVTKTIPVGTSPISISSDQESAVVVTANRDSFDVSVINTSTDTEAVDATTGRPRRISTPPCTPVTTTCPKNLSPIFIAISAG